MKVTKTKAVCISAYQKNNDDPDYILCSENPEFDFYIYLGDTEVSFEVPAMPSDEELNNRQVAYLRKGREEVVEEFTKKLANIDEQISELLALPCLEE